MNKIEMEIVALQSSVTHLHSYAIVLGEINGNRRIPIVIGGFEAQAIAVALEDLKPKRPLTHDLFTIFFSVFQINLKEVLIYRLDEGIFFSKLVCTTQDDSNVYEIDCRTSDALALALRTGSPIYANESVIDAAGTAINDPDQESQEQQETEKKYNENPLKKYLGVSEDQALKDKSIEELQLLLAEVLEKEDYNYAVKIRDEINRRKEK